MLASSSTGSLVGENHSTSWNFEIVKIESVDGNVDDLFLDLDLLDDFGNLSGKKYIMIFEFQ